MILLSGFFVEREDDRDLHMSVYRASAFLAGPKFPFRYRLDCSSFKLPLRRPNSVSIPHIAIRIDDEIDQHFSSNASATHFKWILRARLKSSHRLLIELGNIKNLDPLSKTSHLTLRDGNRAAIDREAFWRWRLKLLNKGGVGYNLRHVRLHRGCKIGGLWRRLVGIDGFRLVGLDLRHFHQLNSRSVIYHYFYSGGRLIFPDPCQSPMKSERYQNTNDKVAAHLKKI